MRKLQTLSDLTPDPGNANRGTQRGLSALDRSLRQYGAGRSVLIGKHGRVIAGNKTVERAVDVGIEGLIVVPTYGTKLVAVQRMDLDLETDSAAKALAVADNRVAELDLQWNPAVLSQLSQDLDLSPFWTDEELATLLAVAEEPAEEDVTPLVPEVVHQTLASRFIVPPFSVLDARQGYWQERKRAWLALGIQSELGRGGGTWIESASGGPDDRQRGYNERERESRNDAGGDCAEPGGDPGTHRQVRATPGGSLMPAADYSRSKARGDGRGRAIHE